MAYPIIAPPFTLKFKEMSKAELKSYAQWLKDQIPGRIAVLAKSVGETPGFEEWKTPSDPDSLLALGEWYALQVATRPKTAEEIASPAKTLAEANNTTLN